MVLKNLKIIAMLALVIPILISCGGKKETKTLYGTWEEVLNYNEVDKKWFLSEGDCLISISGKCESIEVTKTMKGDLANPDIPMKDPKCFGNRDEISWIDQEDANVVYNLKLDASKDTLMGVITINPGDSTQYDLKVKFARI